MARGRARRVLLVVNPTDRELEEAVAAIDPELIQLHGTETPERVAAIRARVGRPIMKAFGIATDADLDGIAPYLGVVDRTLLDAKQPSGAGRPGGNGVAFDWRLLHAFSTPSHLDPGPDIVLSGGLTPENVAVAVAVTGLRAVDVSSGVETSPGEKDVGLILRFVEAARAAFAAAETRRVA